MGRRSRVVVPMSGSEFAQIPNWKMRIFQSIFRAENGPVFPVPYFDAENNA
jgi:hypothetical protein